MKYQIVVQAPSSSLREYDAMISAEGALIENLSHRHEVDGHDAGMGEANIFILTNDVRDAFDEIKAILQSSGFWTDARVAYRKIDGDGFTIIWPAGLREFDVR